MTFNIRKGMKVKMRKMEIPMNFVKIKSSSQRKLNLQSPQTPSKRRRKITSTQQRI